MKKNLKLLLLAALFGQLNIIALEKPETADINPETADLKKDVDTAKKAGTLGPDAAKARALETNRLRKRYFELALKADKTPAEQEEFKAITQELKARLGTALDWQLNMQF